ncbi:hypothetical protein TPA0910_30600 [Streptomyces hygroscopicus subsp. sporocinereus]|uniref:HD Cas3-type domain-containing protein n=2 Tax=Streptomyces hygroscopicus TaxID=1912 RepID=A0ABQ3TZ18_STRHY|nr:hypothetical protein TPA0910_30600 [Streptomyces hygroscopicus]
MMRRQDELDESAWGKSRGLDPERPPYPLVRHLLDAAAMALHLWDVYLSENQRVRIAMGMGLGGELERARALVGLCAGLHDIGKLSGFQFCSRHGVQHLSAELRADSGLMSAERVGHDVAGMAAAADVLKALGFKEDEDCSRSSVADSCLGRPVVVERGGSRHGRAPPPGLSAGAPVRRNVTAPRAVHSRGGTPWPEPGV